MAKPRNNSGTQPRERARQQKQAIKELKRMMTRQKKTFARTPAPLAHSYSVEPIFADEIVGGKDLHMHPSMKN